MFLFHAPGFKHIIAKSMKRKIENQQKKSVLWDSESIIYIHTLVLQGLLKKIGFGNDGYTPLTPSIKEKISLLAGH